MKSDYLSPVLENCRGRYRVEWLLPCLVEMGLDPEARIQAFDTFAAAVNKFMRVKALSIYQVSLYDKNGERMWLYHPDPDPLDQYCRET